MSYSPPWRPTAPLHHLQQRAQILQTIRAFFAERNVLEVETPLLGQTSASDPFINSLSLILPGGKNPSYLQTSPEFPMKRLLAAGSGCIYQICKAFRAEEQGRLHGCEFTMLEWYRVGFDHHQLMDEMDALLSLVLRTQPAERCTYAELFNTYLDIDPHLATVKQLEECARKHGLTTLQNPDPNDANFWRHLLMSHFIEPHIGQSQPTFVMDFPASQAALARVRNGTPPTAERFEVYFKGVELANGYHELGDPLEQERRFDADNQRRRELGLPEMPLDTPLLAALNHGFPDCAGVALGIDRLMMLALGAESIAEVMSF